ncbi:hypothetical protein GCM10027445_23700 [Amycolatopsis endophytica]|uniref:Uncharacterized protein n=1 Tax=Amycolatopsis endophytica TaxID=860233 RepID=A0A853BGH2_9PSEU|nr:hypothetical protein [Amycolatopsis endophytica]NYI93636.1 hypothetical protein [Amycolatopsis endophytica]
MTTTATTPAYSGAAVAILPALAARIATYRIDDLDEHARRLVRTAFTVGESFEFVLQHVIDVSDERDLFRTVRTEVGP